MTPPKKFQWSILLNCALGLGLLTLPSACVVDGGSDTTSTSETSGSSGDGDGDPTTTGDGDGDPATGDGDGEPACDPGSFGCECNGGLCDAGLMCVNGICELAEEGCDPGTLDCECDNGMCQQGLECINDVCSLPPSPFPNCGWDGQQWFVCGSNDDNPTMEIECSSCYEENTPCPMELTVVGCCDDVGNNYWCEGGTVAFDNCGGDPAMSECAGMGTGDGDGDGMMTGDGDGDGMMGDGDGDGMMMGDGDGDPPPPGDGDGDPMP